MPNFRYKAVNEVGIVVDGTIVADTPSEARAKLRQSNLFPKSVKGDTGEGEIVPTLRRIHLPGSSVAPQVAIFTRQFATLLLTGVPIVDALAVLARQTEHRHLASAIASIREAVRSGKNLSEALTAYPRYFDASYVGMVGSGEKSGTLDSVLMRLADFLDRRWMLRGRLIAAFTYPMFLIAIGLGVLLFLLTYLVPKISVLLVQQGRHLPWLTKTVFVSGTFLRDHAFLIVAVAAGLVAAGVWGARTQRGRRLLHALTLRVPLIGPLVRKSLVSRFAMSLSAILRSGVPAAEALGIVARLTPNTLFADEIENTRLDVLEGRDISERMSRSKLFPPMVGYMIAVAEKSGALSEVLEYISAQYDREVDIASKRLLAALDPLIIVFMGAVVALIVLSVILPIMEMSRLT